MHSLRQQIVNRRQQFKEKVLRQPLLAELKRFGDEVKTFLDQNKAPVVVNANYTQLVIQSRQLGRLYTRATMILKKAAPAFADDCAELIALTNTSIQARCKHIHVCRSTAFWQGMLSVLDFIDCSIHGKKSQEVASQSEAATICESPFVCDLCESPSRWGMPTACDKETEDFSHAEGTVATAVDVYNVF